MVCTNCNLNHAICNGLCAQCYAYQKTLKRPRPPHLFVKLETSADIRARIENAKAQAKRQMEHLKGRGK